MSSQQEVVDRHSSVLSELYNLAKSRTLAQLACSHRLQRTLDVQARSLVLAERLNKALRQEHEQQLNVGTKSDDGARRRSIGKLQQVDSTVRHSALVSCPCLRVGLARGEGRRLSCKFVLEYIVDDKDFPR